MFNFNEKHEDLYKNYKFEDITHKDILFIQTKCMEILDSLDSYNVL